MAQGHLEGPVYFLLKLKVYIKRPPGIAAWKKWEEATSDRRSDFHNNWRAIRLAQLPIHVSPGCILIWYTLQEQHDITGSRKHVRESLCNMTQELIAGLHRYIIACRYVSAARLLQNIVRKLLSKQDQGHELIRWCVFNEPKHHVLL